MSFEAREFRVLESADAAERKEWLQAWKDWPAREVFAHPAYLDLFADSGTRSCLAIAEVDSVRVLYPFHLRRIPSDLQPITGDLTDISTPFGYGGPYVIGAGDHEAAADRFWSSFVTWAARQTVVSEFIRFDLHADRLLPYPGDVEVRSTNVVRLLDFDPDSLWMDVSHKVRKNVKRARSLGLETAIDRNGDHLDDFYRIYAATMDRRAVVPPNRFDLDWFRAFIDALPGMTTLFHVFAGEQVVASELILTSASTAYSFLGGTDADAFQMRPNDLLKWEAFLWARSLGLGEFVLGGGWGADDGIFKYKASFAPRGLVPFRVGRRVLDPTAYANLIAAASKIRGGPTDGRFFPAYRAS